MDAKVCASCIRKTCSINDVIERNRMKTERYTCPLKLLQNGPGDKRLEMLQIDIAEPGAPSCIHCSLCVLLCSKGNLSSDDSDSSFSVGLGTLCTQNEVTAENASNVLATSYLNCLFDFAANTNLNKSLAFDGYVSTRTEREAFVEVDLSDDSLESFRRILGDILCQNFEHRDHPIRNGVLVLSHLPVSGSRDVYTVADQTRRFPKTSNLTIYLTTFSLLRYFASSFRKNQYELGDLFFRIADERLNDYRARLLGSGMISEDRVEILLS